MECILKWLNEAIKKAFQKHEVREGKSQSLWAWIRLSRNLRGEDWRWKIVGNGIYLWCKTLIIFTLRAKLVVEQLSKI